MTKHTEEQSTVAECEEINRSIEAELYLTWLPGRRLALAEKSFNLGGRCSELGHTGLALTCFRRVQSLLARMPILLTKKSLAPMAVLAASHNRAGILALDAGRAMDARPDFERAIEIRTKLKRRFPKERENEVYLGGALCNLAHAVADADPAFAATYYKQCLSTLRQPTQTCECSYWDEDRQSWWCTQLEALGDVLGLQWVFRAPQFVDNAMRGLASLAEPQAETPQP